MRACLLQAGDISQLGVGGGAGGVRLPEGGVEDEHFHEKNQDEADQ